MAAIVLSQGFFPAGRVLSFAGVVTVLACCAAASAVDAAEPELKSVFPTGCQLGKSVEISLVGANLDKGSLLHFSQSGLSAEPVEKNRFRVTAAADAAVGDGELWVATAEGLVGPRRFSVTAHAVIVEQEGEDAGASSQQVTVPAVIDGRFDKPADLDWFAFAGQAGQLITIHCRSRSLDGSALPVVTIFGPAGRDLIHSAADAFEPRVTYRLPSAGTYRVRVHDRSYRQDDFSFYRLEVTADAPAGIMVQRPAGLLHPDDLDATISIQDEQAHSRRKPQGIVIPSRVAGRLAQPNEVDWFRFQAKKDQTIHLEAFGERLGQMMDLDAAIYDSQDKQMAGADDLAAPKGILAASPLASLDPAINWKVPADGEYTIALRDLYGGSVYGPHRRYELIVALQKPNVLALAMPADSQRGRGGFVKRGGKTTCSVTIVRSGGWDAPVHIRAVDLAPGITLEPCVLAAKDTTKPIHISATADASVGFHSLRLVAETEIGSDKRTFPVLNGVQIRAGIVRRVDDMIIYVNQ